MIHVYHGDFSTKRQGEVWPLFHSMSNQEKTMTNPTIIDKVLEQIQIDIVRINDITRPK